MSAIRALRLGSYSIVATLPATPTLSRLKSILRYSFRYPPPWWRVVIRPWLLRPAWVGNDSRSVFSGLAVVISSKPETDMKRRPGLVGLNFLIGIRRSRTALRSFDLRQG